MDQTFEKRKKIIYEFICDEFYVPMKLKELAILLQVPKEQKNDLKKVMDSLEAELLLAGPETGELLELARKLIRCEVLEEPVGEFSLYGLSEAQQRQHSHFPQDHYGIPHFMPDYSDGEKILILNRCRTAARAAELAAAEAFTDSEGNLTREDIIRALNRMSSMIYILMLKHKKLRMEN